MAPADLNRDGWPDIIIGAMDLESIATLQRRSRAESRAHGEAVLLFENRMHARSNVETH